MHRRMSACAGAAAAALACMAFAGGASAAPTTYSGTVANGGCAGTRTVTVSGPSRIDAEVSSTSAADTAYAEILAPDGSVAASGAYASYDTKSGGAYSIRVCTWYSHIDPRTLQFDAIYATGPAGQSALPRPQGGVLGATTTLSRDIHGTGAIATHRGLAYFTVRLKANGAAVVRVYDPRANRHYAFTNAGVRWLANGVSLSQGRMTMRVLEGSTTERIVFRSPRLHASGRVVKGGYLIV
jgi:hypothetical protein